MEIRGSVFCGLLVVLTLSAFAPTLQNDFINYDDRTYVVENPHVQRGVDATSLRWAFTATRAANWHPLTWLSHMLDWSLHGDRPLGHHLTNLLLHTANVVLLFLLLGRATGQRVPSALAAALFAVHPLHVESVAWIAERKDVLSTLFWLLTMWAYIGYARSRSPGRLALVTLLTALGLMAKPMLVTLPFTLLLLDVWPLRRTDRGWHRLVIEKLPLFALSAASIVVTFTVQRAGGAMVSLESFSPAVRLTNAVWSYAAYLGMTLWPQGLAVIYPHSGTVVPWWKVGAAAALLVAITLAAVGARRARPYLLVGWLWYLGTLVPVIGLVQVGRQALADRYTYVPLIGFFVIVAWGAWELGRRWTIPAVATVLILAALTFVQTTRWRDSITLFEHTLAVTSGNVSAHVGLGTALEEQGKTAAATQHYEQALRIDPAHHIAHNRIAGLLAREGRLDDAIGHYRSALQTHPTHAETLSNLGIALAKRGNVVEAIERFRQALASRPDEPAAVHVNLGNALVLSGDLDSAVEQYREALRLDPEDGRTRRNLGVVERRLEEGGR